MDGKKEVRDEISEKIAEFRNFIFDSLTDEEEDAFQKDHAKFLKDAMENFLEDDEKGFFIDPKVFEDWKNKKK